MEYGEDLSSYCHRATIAPPLTRRPDDGGGWLAKGQ